MSPRLDIGFQFPDWQKRLKRAEDRINRFIAAGIQTNRGMMFDAEGGFNGHDKWAPLKCRDGQILSKTGTLRKSISPSKAGKQLGVAGPDGFVQTTGNLIRKTTVVGTRVAYAAMMNWGTTGLPGGVLRPKSDDGVLRFKCGNAWVFAKEVTIPARHFDEWNEADAADLEAGLTELIAGILNGE